MKKLISLVLTISLILALGVYVSGANPKTAVLVTEKTIKFEDLNDLVLGNNLSARSLAESIAMIDEMDYETMEEDLRDGLNKIAEAQWTMESMSGAYVNLDYQIDKMDSLYDTQRELYDSLKDGSFFEDNEKNISMLKNGQKGIVIGAESLFIAYKNLEITLNGLERQLDALDRTMNVLQIRKDAGQISELSMLEAESGRIQLESGIETLKMNMEQISLQLKDLLGIGLNDKIRLADVNSFDTKVILSMNQEEDLKSAKSASFELQTADDKFEDAQEDFKDAKKNLGADRESNEWIRAMHTYNAAEIDHQAAYQSYELKFRKLYLSTKDLAQIYEAKLAQKDLKQKTLDAAKIKYSYGQISNYQLLTEQDNYNTYLDELETAKLNLFSSYVTYQHAVKDGILN